MSGYQDCTGAVGFHAQEFGFVHSEAVPVQTEGEDVADIGVDFAAGQDEDAVATSQFGGGFRGPKIIVFCEANSIEAAGFGRLNQIIYGNETVIGFRVGVSVQIDKHWDSRGALAGGNHITERSPVETREGDEAGQPHSNLIGFAGVRHSRESGNPGRLVIRQLYGSKLYGFPLSRE